MPVEERTTRAERCSQHPGIAAVARCDGCGRALCLSCAIPVRGLVLGSECLAQAIGEEASAAQPATAAPPSSAATIGAFALAAVATLPPWTDLGDGSGAFGAWSGPPRWSTIAAAAAVLGLAASVAARRITVAIHPWSVALAVLGALVAAASILASFHPPFPADATPAPWVAAVAGGTASAAALVRRRRHTSRS